MNLRVLILVIYLLAIGLQAQTNKKQVSFRELTVKDGLSQNSIVSIAQDSIGYMWFATQDGLNKYNGITFTYFNKQYQDVTRSSFAQLGQLYTDSLGDLWSYSSNENIERYNYKEQKFDSISSLKKATVLYRQNAEILLVGTLEDGLKSVDLLKNKTLSLYKNELSEVSIFDIQNINNSIYLGTSKGVFKIEDGIISNLASTNNYAVSNICKRDNYIIIGTYGQGLKSINLKTGDLSQFLQNSFPSDLNVQDVFLDTKKRLWIATYGNGLYQVKSNNVVSNYIADKENPFALHYNDILKIYEDMTGNIWFGSDGGGLSYYDEHLVKFNTITPKQVPENISVDVVRAISVDSLGVIWLGTSGKGLTRIDNETKSYKTFTTLNSNLSSNRVMSLLYVNNNLLIGHQDTGLQILNSEGIYKSYPELAGKAIWKIYKDKNDYIWLCTRNSGIIKFNLNNGIVEEFNSLNSILPNNIRTVEQDANNLLWIGTESQGLYTLDNNLKEIKKIDAVPDKIKSLLFLNKKLWIGTNGNGIKVIDTDGNKLVKFKAEYNLPNNVVYALLPDSKDNIWITTNKGISRLSNNHLSKYDVENYSIINGLQAFEFNTGAYFKAADGQLYFGGIDGVNWFDPNDITYNKSKPKTVISKFEVFGKQHELEEDLVFKHNQNTMTFTFSGLHFSHPEKNLYRYKLVNHDTDWTKPAYKNIAHYTNLPPNDYEFLVLSSNYEGVWNKVPTKFKFTILKPWYATNFAWIIYASLILLSIYVIYRYFKFRWEMQTQLRLEHAETERLKKLDEFKTKLYTNISHEFRTPLTLISGPVDKQLERNDLLEKDKKDLSLVKQNANRLLNLVNQMIDLSLLDSGQLSLKITKGNLGVLLNQIIEAFKYKATEKSIVINTNIKKISEAYFDKDIIEKVTSNLLSNAIKYAPSKSKISFDANTQENALIISIVNKYDNVARKDLSKLFQRFYQDDEAAEGIGVGLALVKELVMLSKGSIIANNIENNKIQFTVTLPINKDAFLDAEINDKEENQLDEIINSEPNNTVKNTILIVEDQKDIRDFIRSVFEANYHVIVARNGEEGIKKTIKYLPEIVISDIMMPVKDGIELCNTIKFNTLTSHIPIILLTAKVGDENKIEGLKAGADVYVTKPFNSKLLLVEVERLISNRQLLRERYSKEFIINPELAITSTETEFLSRLQSVLDANITNSEFKSERMSELLQMSRTQLHRKLKSIYGLSTSEFIRSQRLKLALPLLKESDATISEIAYQVGFNSPSYFIKCFKETYNTTPNDYFKSF